MSSTRAESFFERLDDVLVLGMMARPGRQLAEAHRAQLPAQGLLGDRDGELVPDPLCEIDQPPADHPVSRRDRPALDNPGKRLALGLVELRRLAPTPCHRQARPAPRR